MARMMSNLFRFGSKLVEPEPLGEDMSPPPNALEERHVLAGSKGVSLKARSDGHPFTSAVTGPLRDF